jgi:hypothetical protein
VIDTQHVDEFSTKYDAYVQCISLKCNTYEADNKKLALFHKLRQVWLGDFKTGTMHLLN